MTVHLFYLYSKTNVKLETDVLIINSSYLNNVSLQFNEFNELHGAPFKFTGRLKNSKIRSTVKWPLRGPRRKNAIDI